MIRTALVLHALVLLASPAAAQDTSKWGAIAYGAPEQKTGMAVDFATAQEAREAALANCGGHCASTLVFLRTCGSVAQNTTGGVGWSISRWRGRADARALAACGPDCTVTGWVCTTH